MCACPEIITANQFQSSQHLKTHSRPYSCKQCHKAFALRSDLARHEHARHKLGRGYHACIVNGCPFKATRKDNIRQHMRNKHQSHASGKRATIQTKRRLQIDIAVSSINVSLSISTTTDAVDPLVDLPTLFEVATTCNMGLLHALLTVGADVSAQAEDGSTALHCAVHSKQPDVMQ